MNLVEEVRVIVIPFVLAGARFGIPHYLHGFRHIVRVHRRELIQEIQKILPDARDHVRASGRVRRRSSAKLARRVHLDRVSGDVRHPRGLDLVIRFVVRALRIYVELARLAIHDVGMIDVPRRIIGSVRGSDSDDRRRPVPPHDSVIVTRGFVQGRSLRVDLDPRDRRMEARNGQNRDRERRACPPPCHCPIYEEGRTGCSTIC